MKIDFFGVGLLSKNVPLGKTFLHHHHKQLHPNKTFQTILLCLLECLRQFDELHIEYLQRNI